jgi:hypothetical protein
MESLKERVRCEKYAVDYKSKDQREADARQ